MALIVGYPLFSLVNSMQENDNTKTISIALLFSFFFVTYFFTGLHNQSSLSLEDYPFGADSPFYFFNGGIDKQLLLRHVTTVLLSSWLNDIFNNIKVFYAVTGALGVVISYGIFSQFFNSRLSILCSCIYGFSLSIWFFSSFPESYIVTTIFINLYIYIFLKIKNEVTFLKLLLLSLVLILSVINDITSLMILLLPAVYYNKRLFREKQILQKMIIHCFIVITISLAILSVISYKYHNMSPFKYYSIYSRIFNAQQYTWRDITEPLFNSLIFNIAAPEKVVSFHTKAFPLYIGFFKPSLLSYLTYFPSLLLFLMYVFLVLSSAIRIIKFRKELDFFQIALLIYIASRVIAFSRFINPGEAFLYSSVLVLPILFILFVNFQKIFPKYVDHFLTLFLFLLIATNLRFFIFSNYIY